MHTALYLYAALALGICVLTYLLEMTGRMIPMALIILVIIGKIVLMVLSPVYVLIWYLVDAKGCKAAYADQARRASGR